MVDPASSYVSSRYHEFHHQIPEFLHRQVEQIASQDSLSVDQFFATAASEKLSVMEAVDNIAAGASRADDTAFLEAARHIPDAPVTEEGDRMP